MNKKIIFSVTFIILFIFITMLFHEIKYFKKAEKLEKNGKVIYAIDYYSYVILSYFPFSPFIKKAETKILDLGEKFENKREFYKALFAYEILRSSYFQVRSFYQPKKKLIKKLNYKIAKIKVEILKSENRLKNKKKEYKRQLKILEHNDFPSFFGSFIMSISFIGWIGAIIFMILKGFEKENANRKIIFLSLGVYILFFTIWIASLYLV